MKGIAETCCVIIRGPDSSPRLRNCASIQARIVGTAAVCTCGARPNSRIDSDAPMPAWSRRTTHT